MELNPYTAPSSDSDQDKLGETRVMKRFIVDNSAQVVGFCACSSLFAAACCREQYFACLGLSLSGLVFSSVFIGMMLQRTRAAVFHQLQELIFRDLDED